MSFTSLVVQTEAHFSTDRSSSAQKDACACKAKRSLGTANLLKASQHERPMLKSLTVSIP